MKNRYSRLGTGKILAEQLKACTDAGASVTLDKEAGTAVAAFGPVEILRAIRKGGTGQPWIISYNAEFWEWGLAHLTLNTGHLRMSPRSEVLESTVRALDPLVAHGGGWVPGMGDGRSLGRSP